MAYFPVATAKASSLLFADEVLVGPPEAKAKSKNKKARAREKAAQEAAATAAGLEKQEVCEMLGMKRKDRREAERKAAEAEQLASALVALKNSNPNPTTQLVIKKIDVNKQVLKAAVYKVQEQTTIYLKTNSNAELRKCVEEQQKAARVLVAEMVGYIVALGYVGANTGLRVLGLNPTPANPANATPITELDAPVIARAVKDNATLTTSALDLAKSFSAPTAQGQARMLTEASEAAYEVFTRPMVTESGASTPVITSKPTFGRVVVQTDAMLDPGTQTDNSKTYKTAPTLHGYAARAHTLFISAIEFVRSIIAGMWYMTGNLITAPFMRHREDLNVQTYFGFSMYWLWKTYMLCGYIMSLYCVDYAICQVWSVQCTNMLPTRTSPFYDISPVHVESQACGRISGAVRVGEVLGYVGMNGTDYDSIALFESAEQGKSRLFLYGLMHTAVLFPTLTAHTGVLTFLWYAGGDIKWLVRNAASNQRDNQEWGRRQGMVSVK